MVIPVVTLLIVGLSVIATVSQQSTEVENMRNDWISPYFILTYYHSKCAGQAQAATAAIFQNASDTASQGPWSVLHDGALSPDNNPHSYVSWAPYYWPACCEDLGQAPSAVKKRIDDQNTKEGALDYKGDLDKLDKSSEVVTTPLSIEPNLPNQCNVRTISTNGIERRAYQDTQHQLAISAASCTHRPKGWDNDVSLIYKRCPYNRRDGSRNPDVSMLTCASAILQMARAVRVNALAYGLTRDETFAQRAVRLLRTFFLDSRTGVAPHVNYGQIIRGPPGAGDSGDNDWSKGTFRGLIEWRYMLHVVNAIVIIRACGSRSWSTLDAAQMSKWTSDYLHWLETAPISLETKNNGNNMASFYYNQVIALYILLGKTEEAANQANEYFTGPFMAQIAADGNQPLEASRARSLHYLIFGLEGMIVNAKLADNLGLNMWTAKTTNGSTIQDAVDYVLTLIVEEVTASMDTVSEDEISDYSDFAAHVSVALTVYGDRQDGRYSKYLANDRLTSDPDHSRTWRLYNQQCSFYSSPSKGNTLSSQKFR